MAIGLGLKRETRKRVPEAVPGYLETARFRFILSSLLESTSVMPLSTDPRLFHKRQLLGSF